MTPESQPFRSETQGLMDYRIDPYCVFAIGVKKAKKGKLNYAKWKDYSTNFPEGKRIYFSSPASGISIDVGINIIQEALEYLKDIFTGQDLILRFSTINNEHEHAKTILKIEAFRSDGELVARAFIAGRTDLMGIVL